MNITLQKIDASNWKECINLKVGITQLGYIGTNENSLAKSSVTPDCFCYGIYLKDTMVGFVMFCENTRSVYEIYRLMIDFDYQSKGIGKIAMKQIIEKIGNKSETIEKIKILFVRENIDAENFYLSCDFKDSGETKYEEDGKYTEKIFYYYLK